jgi:tetratricopeptide (TPR) repeat protein
VTSRHSKRSIVWVGLCLTCTLAVEEIGAQSASFQACQRARKALHNQDYLEAEKWYSESIRLNSQEPDFIKGLDSLLGEAAACYFQMGLFSKSQHLYIESGKVADQILDRKLKARLWIVDKFAESPTFLEKSATIRRLRDKTYIVPLLIEQGSLEEAEREIESGAQLIALFDQQPQDERMLVDSINDPRLFVNHFRGQVLRERGEYDEAIEQLRIAFEGWKKFHNGADLHEVKLQIATIYALLGRAEEAHPLYEEVITIGSDGTIPFSRPFVKGALGLAALHERNGKYDLAENLYSIALSSAERAWLLVTKVEQANVLLAWGISNFRRGKIDEAKSRLERSIKLRLDTQGAAHPRYADALGVLAAISAVQKDYENAASEARQAIAILDQALVLNNPRKTPVLVALVALTALQHKSPIDQIPEYVRLKEIATKPLGPPYESTMEEIRRYAELFRKANDAPNALALEKLGESLRESP